MSSFMYQLYALTIEAQGEAKTITSKTFSVRCTKHKAGVAN